MTREDLDRKMRDAEEMAQRTMIMIYNDCKRCEEIMEEMKDLQKRIRAAEIELARHSAANRAFQDIRWMLPS